MPTEIRAELQVDLTGALHAIDSRMYEDVRDKLEVNRKGRKVPHYPFVPSLCNPDPWGIPNYNPNFVHKKVGKKSGSKRGRK